MCQLVCINKQHIIPINVNYITIKYLNIYQQYNFISIDLLIEL